jgi:cytochrome c553
MGVNVVKSIVLVSLAAIAGLTGTLALAEDSSSGSSAAAENMVTNVCQNCHGPHGDSVSSTFPRLNGQQADYIVSQLKNFREHSRADPHARAYMWGMASQLDDATIDALAKYFAAQTPAKPQSGGALAAEGKDVFMKGAPAQNVPACQDCHGEHGDGNSVIPRLAGQHADYLKGQLEAFRSTLRESDVMHANTKDMTDRQIEALVSYLAND